MRKLLTIGTALALLGCAAPRLTLRQTVAKLGEPCGLKHVGTLDLVLYCLGEDRRVRACAEEVKSCSSLLVVVYEGEQQVAFTVVSQDGAKSGGEGL